MLSESTYTVSNEQAMQKIRIKLDSLLHVERTEWDAHLNNISSFIAQFSMRNVTSDDRQKKSMLIKSLPESLSAISTVSSAQADLTVERVDALVSAELDHKSNPQNLQGLNNSRHKANTGQFGNRNVHG